VADSLACGRDFSVLYAPYVNSYRRYMAGTFARRGSWPAWTTAPAVSALWATRPGDSRREPLPGRRRQPLPAFAAAIAAGTYGITHGLTFEGIYSGDAYRDPTVREVPKSL
jgi:glutamine synthetase